MNENEITLIVTALRSHGLSMTDQLAVIAALDFCRKAAATPEFAVEYGAVAQNILTRD